MSPCRWEGRDEGGGEGGFSLLEMMVVTSLLLVVLGAILGVLQSVTNAELRAEALAGNQEQVRLALVNIDRDLRGAQNLVALPDPTQYPYQVEFSTVTGLTMRWRLDTAAKVLYRETYNATAGTWTADRTLTSVVNAVTNAPVFRYYRDASNTELDPAFSQSGDVANCTIHIHVQLKSNPVAGPAAFTTEADVELRNRLPGGIVGC